MSCRGGRATLLKSIFLAVLTIAFSATCSGVSQEVPRLEIHVYPDNSVKLLISGTQVVESQAHGYIELYAQFHESKVKLSLNATSRSPEMRSVYPQLEYAYLSMFLASTVRDRMVIGRSRIDVNITSRDGSMAIKADNIEFREHIDKMISNISGRVRIAASGAAAQIIPYIHLLPYMIEPALRQANITYVKVKSITVTPEGKDAVTVSFSIEVNGTQALRQLGLDVRALPERKAYPVNLSLTLMVSSQGVGQLELDLEIGANINTLLSDAVKVPAMQLPSRFTAYDTVYGIGPSIRVGQETMDRALRVGNVLLNEFIRTFMIVPSDAVIKVSTRDSQRLEFYLGSPKIVKINATNPGDTLRALHDYVMRISNSLRETGVYVRLEDLLQMHVVIEAKENVRITLDGNMVSNATFADLPRLRVEVRATVTPTPTTTPQPAEALPIHIIIVIVVAVVVAVGTATALILIKRR